MDFELLDNINEIEIEKLYDDIIENITCFCCYNSNGNTTDVASMTDCNSSHYSVCANRLGSSVSQCRLDTSGCGRGGYGIRCR